MLITILVKLYGKKVTFYLITQYDCISGGASNKIDPRRYQTSETKESQIVNMLFAASASDSVLLQKYLQVTQTVHLIRFVCDCQLFEFVGVV